jgi:hypothetical protein
MAPIFARLDKTGRWLVCGVRDCGITLAIANKDPEGVTGIILPPGWSMSYKGPVWRFSSRARRAYRFGHIPEPRKVGGMDENARPGFEKASDGSYMPVQRIMGSMPLLPVLIECHARRCGMVQLVDAARLGVWAPSITGQNRASQPGMEYTLEPEILLEWLHRAMTLDAATSRNV